MRAREVAAERDERDDACEWRVRFERCERVERTEFVVLLWSG